MVDVGKYIPPKINVSTKKMDYFNGAIRYPTIDFHLTCCYFGGVSYMDPMGSTFIRRGVFGLVAGETDLLHAHHAKDHAGLWPQQEGGGSCWKKALVENAVFFFSQVWVCLFFWAFSWDPNEAVFFSPGCFFYGIWFWDVGVYKVNPVASVPLA